MANTPNARLDAIRSRDWQLRIGELGAVVDGMDEIDQAVRVILTTPLGSVPLRPEFGCDAWRWVDAPIERARREVVAASVTAIQRWEPRVEVLGVRVEPRQGGSGLVVWVTRRARGGDGAEGVVGVELG